MAHWAEKTYEQKNNDILERTEKLFCVPSLVACGFSSLKKSLLFGPPPGGSYLQRNFLYSP